MAVLRLSLFAILLFLGACAHISELPPTELPRDARETVDRMEADFILWDSCTRDQAEQWAGAGETDGRAALKAASCYAVLAENGANTSLQLEDARHGRKLAQRVVERFPQSGLAHYLSAYLTGLEAERNPLRGLELVPVIEREALLAAGLNPGVDRGGPDRMLGELYLRAPGFPVSVGDAAKALFHYRRALARAPGDPGNHLGLVASLLAEEAVVEACEELEELLASVAVADEDRSTWDEGLKLLQRLCGMLGE